MQAGVLASLNRDTATIDAEIIPPGTSLITAHDLNDVSSSRIAAYLPKFRAAVVPNADQDDWSPWIELLGSRASNGSDGERGGMTVSDAHGFATVSSSLMALPGPDRFGEKPKWLFASGAPDTTPYEPVNLG